MKLERIPVPLWSPPHEGPWRFKITRPDGTSYIEMWPTLICDDRAEAEFWCERFNSASYEARQGGICTVVPAPDR